MRRSRVRFLSPAPTEHLTPSQGVSEPASLLGVAGFLLPHTVSRHSITCQHFVGTNVGICGTSASGTNIPWRRDGSDGHLRQEREALRIYKDQPHLASNCKQRDCSTNLYPKAEGPTRWRWCSGASCLMSFVIRGLVVVSFSANILTGIHWVSAGTLKHSTTRMGSRSTLTSDDFRSRSTTGLKRSGPRLNRMAWSWAVDR